MPAIKVLGIYQDTELEKRIGELEQRRAPKQTATVYLPDWLSPEPIVFESEHFSTVDIKPEIPSYIQDKLCNADQ